MLVSIVKLAASCCVLLYAAESVAVSASDSIPSAMKYFEESSPREINEMNRLRVSSLGEEIGFALGIRPQFTFSDAILFSHEFESVVFISANSRVNPEYLNRAFTHEDGVLYHVELNRQQLAVFFHNVQSEDQQKIIDQLGKSANAGLLRFLIQEAHAGEIRASGSTARKWAGWVGDSFANCGAGIKQGTVDAYRTVFVDPVWNTYQGIKRAGSVAGFWREEVSRTKNVGKYVRERVRETGKNISNSTHSDRGRFACSFASSAAVGGAAGRVVRTAVAPSRTATLARAKIPVLNPQTAPISPELIRQMGWRNFIRERKWRQSAVASVVNPKWKSLPPRAFAALEDARKYHKKNRLMKVTGDNFNLKNEFGDEINKAQLVSRVLPEDLRAPHARAMELMADDGRWAGYYEDLMGEVFTRMVNSSNSAYRSSAARGAIETKVLEQVLTERLARRGLNVVEIPDGVSILTSNEFRSYLSRGVPLDKALSQTSHGEFPHLLQMDYLVDDMVEASGGQVSSARQFLEFYGGSEKGLTVWNDMFDQARRADGSLRNVVTITRGHLSRIVHPSDQK